jgi:large subunit ribosomal protein L3
VKAILGEKLGMTQVFDDEARAIPVTVVKAGPVRIVQIKTKEKDGYGAVQIAYREAKTNSVNKPMAGHYAKAGVTPRRHVTEVRTDDVSAFTLGQEISLAEVLQEGQKVDVTGDTKGKGYAGVMKRHGFSGQKASHGAHRIHRKPGAIGACATPARVFKGLRMAGRMGGDTETTQNLLVQRVDADAGIVLLRGAVPGNKGAVEFIHGAVKGA